MIRVFLDVQLKVGVAVSLKDRQQHYLKNVMRAAVGQEILVFNTEYGEFIAKITDISKKTLDIEPIKQSRAPIKADGKKINITLFYAPIKSGKHEYLIEKCTELGVSSLRPIKTDRTIVTKVNVSKAVLNAIEAAEQCERLDVPIINDISPFKKAIEAYKGQIFFCDEKKNAKTNTIEWQKLTGNIAFVIGPEGGFTDKEREYLNNQDNVKAISLGQNILRAETASVACLALMLNIG